MIKKTLLPLALILSSIGYTQNKTFSNQQWFQYYMEYKMNENFKIYGDAGYRVKENFSLKSQYIVRTALGYQVAENTMFIVGFAHLGFYSKEKITKVEYRPYMELSLKQQIAKFNIGHRYRIEERLLYSSGQKVKTNSHTTRFRYRFLVNFNLFKWESFLNKIDFNIGDEVFLNNKNNFFDQNRLLTGLNFKFKNNMSISVLYNYQFQSQGVSSYKQDDVLWFGVKQVFN